MDRFPLSSAPRELAFDRHLRRCRRAGVDHDTGRESVAVAEEARQRGARHQRPGDEERRLTASVAIPRGDRDGHQAERGEVVGQPAPCGRRGRRGSVTTEPRKNAVVWNRERRMSAASCPPPPPGARFPFSPSATCGATVVSVLASRIPRPRGW